MANPKSMSYEQLVDYKKQLKSEGKTESSSQELGKVVDLIKTLRPEKYGEETVSNAYSNLSSGVTEFGGWTETNLDQIEEYTGTRPQLGQPSPQQAAGIGIESGMGASGMESFAGLDLSGLTSTQKSSIQAQMAQPSYTDLWEEYRSELGLGEKEALVSDLNKNIFDIEDEIESVEVSFREERPKDFLMTEASRSRREGAEKLPLREQYEDLLTRRERVQGEITSAQGLLETQLKLAQSDMDRVTGIYENVASYTSGNGEAAETSWQDSLISLLTGGVGNSGQVTSLSDTERNFLFGEPQETVGASSFKPAYSPSGGAGTVSADGNWIWDGRKWEANMQGINENYGMSSGFMSGWGGF